MCGGQRMDSKIDRKIKNLNQIRKMYIRDFEELEKQYKNGGISKERFEKHQMKFEKRKEKIRQKIHALEQKMQ